MMPRVGQALRDARTKREIALSDVERVTKIRVKFLRAMEEDRWEDLPAPVYARSFLSTYARFLGLDQEPLVEEYLRTVEGADRPEPIPTGVMRPGSLRRGRSVKPSGLLAAGAVAAALLGLVVLAIVGLGSDGDDEGRTVAAEDKRAGKPSTSTTAQPRTTGETTVELRATAEVWVCLVDADGAQLVRGEILAAGQARGPFASRGFEMTFGNGSIEMTVDGEPVRVPPLAEPLGYGVAPSGARRLDPGSGPTCA